MKAAKNTSKIVHTFLMSSTYSFKLNFISLVKKDFKKGRTACVHCALIKAFDGQINEKGDDICKKFLHTAENEGRLEQKIV